ncbi:SigE family RNA polymerase sigma factor [Microlunatus sp. GCM10028923]|uniref:SigE family RNA polymerase sigma factor n=1 Tax=Microlunatus sp. GCM10028923 TaxID=3273400 RepID=UPI003605B2D9
MSDRDTEFTDFVAAHRTKGRRAAYLLCGDWGLAEDIVQQALIKLYLAWSRVRPEGAEGYLRRIIGRTAINEWRSASRRRTVPDDTLVDLVDEKAPLAYEERSVLLDALQQLPARQRQIVVLRHCWGCSVAEVAKDLHISTGTVKSQTSRALERLNTILSAPHVMPAESAGHGRNGRP